MSVQSLAENPLGCSEAEWETRVELAALYRAVDHYGMSDITNQTICARVPDAPDHFLVGPRA